MTHRGLSHGRVLQAAQDLHGCCEVPLLVARLRDQQKFGEQVHLQLKPENKTLSVLRLRRGTGAQGPASGCRAVRPPPCRGGRRGPENQGTKVCQVHLTFPGQISAQDNGGSGKGTPARGDGAEVSRGKWGADFSLSSAQPSPRWDGVAAPQGLLVGRADSPDLMGTPHGSPCYPSGILLSEQT